MLVLYKLFKNFKQFEIYPIYVTVFYTRTYIYIIHVQIWKFIKSYLIWSEFIKTNAKFINFLFVARLFFETIKFNKKCGIKVGFYTF